MAEVEKIKTIYHSAVLTDTLTKYHEDHTDLLDKVGRVNFSQLTVEEVLELGWPKWADDLPIILIPFYLYDFLAYGQTLICIDGKEIVVKPGYNEVKPPEPDEHPFYIDDDHRGGYLAYGFYPKSDQL